MTTINNINSKSRALSAEEINAFGAELDALRKETMASLGKKEADYIYGVRNFVRYTEIAGRSSLMLGWLPPFWLAGTALFIQSLKNYLMEKYPYDWLTRLKAMLKLLFPADYDKLLASLEAIESYNTWMSENKSSRVFNSKEERLRATWDKRLQLFGEDAKMIWQAQLQQEKVDVALQQLDTSSLPLAAKVDSYVKTLVDVYGKSAIDPEKSHPVQQMY